MGVNCEDVEGLRCVEDGDRSDNLALADSKVSIAVLKLERV